MNEIPAFDYVLFVFMLGLSSRITLWYRYQKLIFYLWVCFDLQSVIIQVSANCELQYINKFTPTNIWSQVFLGDIKLDLVSSQ